MKPDQFYDFLCAWVMIQRERHGIDPWRHEIRVPLAFAPHLRYLFWRHPEQIRLKGVVYPPDERGRYGFFLGFPMILHTHHAFKFGKISENTQHLLKTGFGVSPVAADVGRRPSEGEFRRQQAAGSAWNKFAHKLHSKPYGKL